MQYPDRLIECELAEKWGVVGAMDEVGRGALAGPVCVGVVLVARDMPEPPAGVADSKLLSAKKRAALVQPIKDWALSWGVGMIDADVIGDFGIMVALRRAGVSALQQAGCPDVILLDGHHNWLTGQPAIDEERIEAPVQLEVKADMKCTAVAAASILAKEARDHLMETLPDPGYNWAKNKGYGTKAHKEAVVKLGPSSIHRRGWKLT